MTRPMLTAIVALSLAVGLLACGSTPETVHYRLDLEPSRVDQPPESRPALAIEHFGVDAAYDQPQIAYRDSPYRLQRYHYHRWAAPPGLLLTDALRSAYQATGRFASVTSGTTARSDLVLSGHIAALEEVDVTEDEWIGRVVLELRVRDATTGDLLWSDTVERRETLEERSPAGLAEALSRALTSIVEETSETFVDLHDRQSDGT